ncbi:MAG: S9 family peptidase, partial [Saprospiraceae bacterium]
MKKNIITMLAILCASISIQAQDDKFLWLEEVDGKEALQFVENQNKATLDKLSTEKNYKSIYDKSLEISNSSERIIYPTITGAYVYNFWKDKDHVRGIWRRCLLANYTKSDLNWETLLDLDAMSAKDDVKWVYKGSNGLYPKYDRFLISLSKGGGDAIVIREFDVNKREFISDGFMIDESKGSASYVDENTLIVSSNFGEGTMTSSGYPNQVKLWKRGTLLKDSKPIFEGQLTDVGTWGGVYRDGSKSYTIIGRRMTTFTGNNYVWSNGKAVKLDIPEDCDISSILNNQLLIQLKSDWKANNTTYKSGSLISLNVSDLIKGQKTIQVVLVPDEFSSISEINSTKNKLLVNVLTNVTNQLYIYSFADGKWSRQKVQAPELGTVSVISCSELTDQYFFKFENFITPSTLYFADAGKNTFKAYKSMPAYFDASKYEVKQFKAKSKDGTMIPYFMVSAKNIKHDGNNPTLIYGYGGFEISLQPFYSATFGYAWLDHGGVLIQA